MHLDRLLPLFLRGRVVPGFGRGGKQLGCPTANLEDAVVDTLPPDLPCGVFYGLSRVEGEEVVNMVASIGWNPHFRNERKTLEVHMLRKYDHDFYGSTMEVLILGYIRPMAAYSSLEALKAAINSDISSAEEELAKVDIHALGRQFFLCGTNSRI
ncbi:unnamed protein product [Nippostrongylus brasiliensis]|uniref:riboflavin kinase n=1 Tax=Nippostrongylus brasiliensis TaxID=27835 RepID=A0A0N4XY45_NIPBR|nr:hypothetical protein Q1695_005683 [Nippostrongylus brasiliensis]VDL71566.1 unnamed protein product [Nippostrongylus brasiliensis]